MLFPIDFFTIQKLCTIGDTKWWENDLKLFAREENVFSPITYGTRKGSQELHKLTEPTETPHIEGSRLPKKVTFTTQLGDPEQCHNLLD